MGEQQHFRTLARQFEDSRLHRIDPGDIGGRTLLHRQVQIDANKRDLAGEVGGQIRRGS